MLWNLKLHLPFHTSQYMKFGGLLKSSPHLYNTLLPKIRLNIMPPHTPWSPYSLIPVRISHQNGACIYNVFMWATYITNPNNHHVSSLYGWRWRAKIMNMSAHYVIFSNLLCLYISWSNPVFGASFSYTLDLRVFFFFQGRAIQLADRGFKRPRNIISTGLQRTTSNCKILNFHSHMFVF